MNGRNGRNLRSESRVETRAILRQISIRGEAKSHDHGTLNKREVGSFLVANLQTLWFACDKAGLDNLKLLIEPAFFEAYKVAGGVYNEEVRKKIGIA